MVLDKGRMPKANFYQDQSQSENLTEFKCSGFIFSYNFFPSYVHAFNAEAKSRIRSMFARLPFIGIPIGMEVDLFRISILPIYTYVLPSWLTRCSKSSMKELNKGVLKMLKRYLAKTRS